MALRRSNGEGTIYFNKKTQTYEGQFYYEDPATGERKKKKLSGKSLKVVNKRGKDFLTQMKQERAEVLMNQSKVGTVGEWLDEWLENYIRPSVRVKTYERYRCSINNHILPYIGSIGLDHLTAEDIQAMMNEMLSKGGRNGAGLSPRTVNMARRTLKSALDRAYHLRKIDYNPTDATKASKTEKAEIHVLSRPQAKKLLEAAKSYAPTAYMAILLALSTGMRIGEIFGLLWENVDLEAKMLYVKQSLVSTNHGYRLEPSPKTKAGYRQIELPQRCIEGLKAHRAWQDEQKTLWLDQYKDNGLVISADDGGYKDPSRFTYAIFKRLLERAGIDTAVRFHDLRHTHATWLLEKGVHPKVVAERLGHSSIRITLDTYSHVIKGIQKAAVSKLDEMDDEW